MPGSHILKGSSIWILIVLSIASAPVHAEADLRINLELFNTVYRGLNRDWYYTGRGLADMRIGSIANKKMRAELAVEFYPVDLSGGSSIASTPALFLKHLWIKANFPHWRLTLGKTKLAWGNGNVFNAGDILFGSISPFLDFTRTTIRDDSSWLTAFNIPTGRFSYIEAVLLPPNIEIEESGINIHPIKNISGGLRFFARAGGWRLETGYLYKGDTKSSADILGHRPYFSFHGHAGVDWYGSISLAAGWDNKAQINRNNWTEISKTINLSLGIYRQFQLGNDSNLALRIEGLLMPWQNWKPIAYQQLINEESGYYGLMLYSELIWSMSPWSIGLQSLISPVDGSAHITSTFSWNIFQGFTLLGFVVINAGDKDSLFAFSRNHAEALYYPYKSEDSQNKVEMAGQEFNGINITLGARYSY